MSSEAAQPSVDEAIGAAVSRRAVLAGAGALALLSWARDDARAAATRSYVQSAMLLTLEIDGAFAGQLDTASGGELIAAAPATTAEGLRSGLLLRAEPVKVSLAVPLTKTLQDWATSGRVANKAAIVAYGIDQRETHRLILERPAVTELAIDPRNDGVGLELTVRAERSRYDVGSGSMPPPGVSVAPGGMPRGSVRLLLQGFEAALTQARVAETIVVAAAPALSRTGAAIASPPRALGTAPTRLAFDVPLADAGPFAIWLADLAAGRPAKAVPGLVQLLDRTQKPVLRLDLFDVTPERVSLPFIRNDEAVGRATVVVSAREARLDLKGLVG